MMQEIVFRKFLLSFMKIIKLSKSLLIRVLHFINIDDLIDTSKQIEFRLLPRVKKAFI